jgi:cytidylate kinase
MASRGFVIAVDGPSGVGKSTASRGLARRLGFRYVDTGAMYRALACVASSLGIAAGDAERLASLAEDLGFELQETPEGSMRVLAGGRDVTTEIRRPEVGQLASAVSTHPGVRDQLVRAQQAMAEHADVVMEGRDIGTVVFPDAPVKFFLTADPTERAQRRHGDLQALGLVRDAARIAAEQAERDARDQSRAHSPLRQAPDAVALDTTQMSLEQVIDAMERIVTERRRA